MHNVLIADDHAVVRACLRQYLEDSGRIGEVADIAGVEPYVLRFWESEFGELRPVKSKTGHRTYSRREAELVLKIRDLLYEDGFTIDGARRKLKQRGARQEKPEVPARTQAVLERVRKEVEDLLQVFEE